MKLVYSDHEQDAPFQKSSPSHKKKLMKLPCNHFQKILLLAMSALAVPAIADEGAKIRVASKPDHASVWIDGHSMGKTPCDFDLKIGPHVAEVKAEGYQTWRQVISCDTAAPVSLQAVLEARPLPDAPQDMPDVGAILKSFPVDVLGTLSDVIRQELAAHPTVADAIGPVWMGSSGNEAYALTLRRLPKGDMADRAAQSMGEAVRKKAIAELFLTTELTHQAQETGLDDLNCLRRACGEVASSAAWAGKAPSMKSVGVRCGGWVVGLARAPQKEIARCADFKINQDALRLAYARQVSLMADALLEQKKADEALGFYYHLHARQLASRWNYLNTARAYERLGKREDASKVLRHIYETQHASASVDWLEACGDLAETLETNSALAKAAYEEAAQRLLNP